MFGVDNREHLYSPARMIATSTTLGIGLYTPQEAAWYARVHTQTLNRWLFGTKTGESVVRHEISGDHRAVSFVDFIQMLAIRAIRTQHKEIVSLQKIRAAVDKASEEFGVSYPFARKHVTYVITKGKNRGEIVIRLNDERLVQVTGKKKDQTLIGPIAELYLDSVTWGGDGLAQEYRPWNHATGGPIVMNPHVRFGEPIVQKCGYSALALWEANIAEGGIEAAANAYGVEKACVSAACEYIDYLMIDKREPA